MQADSHTAGATPTALIRGQLPKSAVEIVERIHRRFLHALEEELSNDLKVPVSTSFVGSGQKLYSEVLAAVTAGGSLQTLDLLPQKNHAVLSFPPGILLAILDILLFTPPVEGERRESVTPIELHILKSFFDTVLNSLRMAWGTVYPLSLQSTSPTTEDAEDCIGRMRKDGAVTLTATLRIGQLSADFELAIPSFLARVTDMKARRDTGPEAAPEIVQDRIRDVVQDSKLKVEAVLAGSKIHMRDLVGLSVGQILMSGHRTNADFACLVNGKTRFSGELVPSNGRYGFAVIERSDTRPS